MATICYTWAKFGPVAQRLEHYSYKVGVDGSIPSRPTSVQTEYKEEENIGAAEIAKVVTAVV